MGWGWDRRQERKAEMEGVHRQLSAVQSLSMKSRRRQQQLTHSLGHRRSGERRNVDRGFGANRQDWSDQVNVGANGQGVPAQETNEHKSWAVVQYAGI